MHDLRTRGLLRWHCIMFLMLLCLLSQTGRAADRVLSFPEDRSVGTLCTCKVPSRENGFLSFAYIEHVIGPARGEVRVAGGSQILLQLAPEAAGDLSFLEKLAPDDLHALRIERASLDEKAAAAIGKLQSLVRLHLFNCHFSQEVFDNPPPLPGLAELRVIGSSADANPLQLGKWVARMPRLEFLYVTPPLDKEDLSAIGGHPSLQFVNAKLESLDALVQLPQLRGLNVDASSADQLASAAYVPAFAHVEVINWNGGQIDAALLEVLGQRAKLRTLRLYGCSLAEDFPAGLQSVDHLEELKLTPSDVQCEWTEIASSLLKFDSLRSWPQLRDIDRDLLRKITKKAAIERLELAGVSAEVTRSDLQQLAGLKSLKALTLQNVPLDDDGLRAFKELNQLELLSLQGTEVTGVGFEALAQLGSLQEIRIGFDGSTAPSLGGLAVLPALSSIRLQGYFLRPRDFAPLTECKQLHTLIIDSGMTDDTTARWLGESDNLRDIGLGPDCLMTDAGLQMLAANHNLQALTAGGFITRAGVEALADLPYLRELTIYSSLLDEADQAVLRDHLPSIPQLRFYPLRPVLSELIKGPDGLLRKRDADRTLESQSAPTIDLADVSTEGGQVTLEALRGQVVLVDFWGVWCGPCLMMLPELQRLHDAYHDRGLEIVAVHTQAGSEALPDYLKKNPKPWPVVVDASEELRKAYRVERFPSIYLIDRDGILRVAEPHVLGLEEAIVTLLNEPARADRK